MPIISYIITINETLVDDPSLVSESPEDKGWICKLINFDSSELDDMMDEDDYLEYVSSLKK